MNNKALTYKELWDMIGEPVWLQTGQILMDDEKVGRWEILEYVVTEPTEAFWFTRRMRGFEATNYGKTWLAYRKKP